MQGETCRVLAAATAAVTLVSVAGSPAPEAQALRTSAVATPRIVPAPVSLRTMPGVSFTVTRATRILAGPGSGTAPAYLAAILRRSTGFPLPVAAGGPAAGAIALSVTGSGGEGYHLAVTGGSVRLQAGSAAGLFRAVQTLRQLLPPAVESPVVRPGPWTMPGVEIDDAPRFAWRGTMLDVSRHFFTVAQVKRYIDLAAQYKINVFHLHLTDDQGWRIAIDGWPRLTTIGASTQVGGGAGGYYTQAEYAEIVRYAGERYMTVVPEIDGPGHTNAALASYADLNCDGKAPPPYTGTKVGFSSLCIGKPLTYRFLDEVLGRLAAMTPGPYLHIGGDEARRTAPDDYVAFVGKVARLVHRHGKTVAGWADVGRAQIPAGSVAQFWRPARGSEKDTETARAAVRHGAKLVMSPANHAYLDMKYTAQTRLGLRWAGLVEVRDAYDWDPGTLLDGVTERNVLGVEAPLWSETIATDDEIDFMAFPRLPAIAEIGWSPQARRAWPDFRLRLAGQGPRWDAQGVNFYRSPQVPWPTTG